LTVSVTESLVKLKSKFFAKRRAPEASSLAKKFGEIDRITPSTTLVEAYLFFFKFVF
jgi:hypothetical protein